MKKSKDSLMGLRRYHEENQLFITEVPEVKKGKGKKTYLKDTACLELMHGDDPERCYGEGGGRGVHVWERM